MSFAMFSVGFMASAFGFLVRAMIADVADEVRLETGKDLTAMMYAMVTSTNKVGSTLSVGVAYLILPLFGFVAKEGYHNTPDAIWGLQACYLAPPVICVLIGGLAMWGYKLDEKRSSLYRAGTFNFPNNTEIEVELTYVLQQQSGPPQGGAAPGSGPDFAGGRYFEGVGDVAAGAEAASLRIHHSFV